MPDGFDVSKCAILADPQDPDKQAAIGEAAAELALRLKENGVETSSYLGVSLDKVRPEPDVQLFIVLGGDGAMIHFAGGLNQYDTPFYGLNFGNVGFMMNNPSEGLAHHAAKIRRGEFTIWDFPVLEVTALDLNGNVHKGYGLNDIYLQRMTPQTCRVRMLFNEEPLKIEPLLCDGVIVSTPLGSTAYCYNVTGLVTAIDLPVITLTPIAAQRSCSVSSMVLPLDTRIRLDIMEPAKRRAQVVTDGQSHGDLTQAKIGVSPTRKAQLCFDQEYSKSLPMRFINKACRS